MDNIHEDRPAALVTGAAGGIAAGIVRQLAVAGFDVVLSDIVESEALERACAIVREAGGRAVAIAQDLARSDGFDSFVARATAAFGRLDCLVNNAGVSVLARGDLLDVSEASFDRNIAINLRAQFFLTQRVARAWIAAPSPGPLRRSIVTITSVAADTVGFDIGEYCIAKAGLASMVRQFAIRLAHEGIDCYEIRPGMMRTDMTAVATSKYDGLIASGFVPARRWGHVDEVGKAVASCAAGAIPYAVGQTLHIDGGMRFKPF